MRNSKNLSPDEIDALLSDDHDPFGNEDDWMIEYENEFLEERTMRKHKNDWLKGDEA